MGSCGVVGFTQVRAGGRCVHPGSLGSLGFASVHLPWGSMGSFEVFGFAQVGPWVRWVHAGSLGSLKFALGVTGFIQGRWVHLGSPWGSMGSSGVVRFTGVRPGGRWVQWRSPWGSLGALRFALRVVRFMRGHQVHSGSPLRSLSSSGFVGFPRVCPGVRYVLPGSLGSLGFALRVFRFIQGHWVHSRLPWVSLDSSGVVRFTRNRFGGRQVHPGLLGSLGFALGVAIGVVGFIRVVGLCRAHPKGSLGSSEVVGFTRVRRMVHWVQPASSGSLCFALGG